MDVCSNKVNKSYKTDLQIKKEKEEEFQKKIIFLVGFYRENPHRFAKDFLHINLKPFQDILINEMMRNNYVNYNASRGWARKEFEG